VSTLTDVARAFSLFSAAYPTARKLEESTVAVWAEALAGYPGPIVASAARRWIRTEPRYPSLPLFIDACRALRPDPVKALPAAVCVWCHGSGFEYTDLTGRGTVKRCRQGCDPPLPSQLGELERVRPSEGVFASARDVLARVSGSRFAPADEEIF
jgi:hypothetical protein